MSKKIEKLIKEDIDNNYSFEYNKEELHKQFVIKEKDNIIKLPKYKLILRYVIVLVVGLLIGLSINIDQSIFKDDEIITKEFEEFVKDNGHRIKGSTVKFYCNIDAILDVYIYKLNSRNISDSNNYYYFMIKSVDEERTYFLYFDNDKKIIQNNSFGFLTMINPYNIDQSIRFFIEIDGEIKEFVLN